MTKSGMRAVIRGRTARQSKRQGDNAEGSHMTSVMMTGQMEEETVLQGQMMNDNDDDVDDVFRTMM
jgi:hypothetical protein